MSDAANSLRWTGHSIAGCILAGGQSRRLGGGDKALLDLGGRPILTHVIERLAPQVSQLALNANGDASRFAAFGLPVVADCVEGLPGPLAGILAGLRWAQSNAPGATHVLTVSGDAPFVPLDLAARLRAAVSGQPDRIAIAETQGQPHPVMGLWPVALADDLERELKAGARSVLTLCKQRGAVQVAFPLANFAGREVDAFFNANTPLELAEARLIVQRLTLPSPVIGVAGWKNSGKTTLVSRLVKDLSERGHRISTVKFSHHEGDLEGGDVQRLRDTARHAASGARQVVFAGPARWAIVEGEGAPGEWNETASDREGVLAAIMHALEPADLILVEGFKQARIPKIEVRRSAQKETRGLADADPYIFATASDHEVDAHGRWAVGLDDVGAIAGELERLVGLRKF